MSSACRNFRMLQWFRIAARCASCLPCLSANATSDPTRNDWTKIDRVDLSWHTILGFSGHFSITNFESSSIHLSRLSSCCCQEKGKHKTDFPQFSSTIIVALLANELEVLCVSIHNESLIWQHYQSHPLISKTDQYLIHHFKTCNRTCKWKVNLQLRCYNLNHSLKDLLSYRDKSKPRVPPRTDRELWGYHET